MDNWKLISEEFPPILPKEYHHGTSTWRNTERVLVVVDQTNGTRMVKEGYAEVYTTGYVCWKIPGTIKTVTHWMPMPELPEPVEWVHSYGIIWRNDKGRADAVQCGKCGHFDTKSIQFKKCPTCGALWDECKEKENG